MQLRPRTAVALLTLLSLPRSAYAREPDTEAPPTAAESSAQVADVAAKGSLEVKASSAVAGYGDTDHVFVVSPTVAAEIADPLAGWSVNGRYLVDVVSAASVDIVSTASRRWEEVRNVGALGGVYKPGDFGVGANANVSIEPDYQSYTFSGSVSRDFVQKRVTALLGYEYGHDIAGRSSTPFSVFSHTIDHHALKGGLTAVLDRATVLSGVVDADLENGDTSKPYRYVAMFAPGVDVPRGASVMTVDELRTPSRVLEQVPTKRGRYAITGHVAHRFTGWTLRGSERLYSDSWGLDASTTDARFVFDLGQRVDIGPHFRFHIQSPVVFWQRAYVVQPGFDFPALRTGDRELGPLRTLTAGGALHIALGRDEDKRRWILGLDANAAQTWYLDDLFISQRLSVIGGVSLEAQF